jgi:predicted ABC-type ATPase
MRVFAGPNGSGKSTLKTLLPPELLGIYLNPDDIERNLMSGIDIQQYRIESEPSKIKSELQRSPFAVLDPLLGAVELRIEGNLFKCSHSSPYLAAALADYLRHLWIENHITFTFETVMSSVDKIDLFKKAHDAGYRTYLYYVCTESPDININRVKERVASGGHSVPIDKIRSRYTRSLELLYDAMRLSDRAYIFDNTEEGETGRTWIAEVASGVIELKVLDNLPHWFEQYVLDKARSV